ALKSHSTSAARVYDPDPPLNIGANVNSQDGDGRTALSYACERGCLDAVKILVRNNADPEIVDAWGNTALMYAAVAGHSAVVEFLVRAFKRLGLQVDRQNKAGNSAVEVAKFLGHTECISALTYSAKKTREVDGSSFRNEKFEIKRGHVLDKLGWTADKKGPRGLSVQWKGPLRHSWVYV
uniref:Uncharacterized protein n=1 Tax=Labrus bergylta TaxID=56723 RepID=A0A3Q3GRE5_9LABR